MKITVSNIGGRPFINFGDFVSVPVDRIRKFNFTIANGGASDRSVKIVTDDPDEEIIFAYENCDAVREFLNDNEGMALR